MPVPIDRRSKWAVRQVGRPMRGAVGRRVVSPVESVSAYLRAGDITDDSPPDVMGVRDVPSATKPSNSHRLDPLIQTDEKA